MLFLLGADNSCYLKINITQFVEDSDLDVC